MGLKEKLNELRRKKSGQNVPAKIEESRGGSDSEDTDLSDFYQRIRAAADREIFRTTVASLAKIEEAESNSTVLRVNIFGHYGRDDAQIDAFLFRKGATPKMIGSALGLSDAIDRDTFDILQPGHWYLTKTTQKYGEFPVTVVSNKPLDFTKLLHGQAPTTGFLPSGT